MNKTELVEAKVKDLLAECHEHGLHYLISVCDTKEGDMINAIEGNGSTAIVAIGLFANAIAKKADVSLEEIMEHIRKAIEAAEEVEKEEGKL